MNYTVDRFSGSYSLLEAEDRTVARVERSRLPAEACEGDVLVFRDGEYLVDRDATAKRKKIMSGLLDSLWDE